MGDLLPQLVQRAPTGEAMIVWTSERSITIYILIAIATLLLILFLISR